MAQDTRFGPDLHPEDGGPTVLAERYELADLIGNGPMAQVYRGRDLELDRVVAVKLLLHDAADEPYTRLRQEARTVAALTHRGVVGIHDVGETANGTFIVMEYVHGETLRATLAGRGTFDPGSIVRIGEEICAALQAAHEQGIVHRDINPGNIMLDTDGSVRVLDFGIAQSPGTRIDTQDGTVLGTPAYLSPEQARGDALDARTDLYSLGCCLYELATGRRPFTGDSAASLAYQHIHREPPPPRELEPGIPIELRDVIMRALAKDPDHRHDSAESMRASLARCRDGDAAAEPPAPPGFSSPPARTDDGAPAGPGAAVGAHQEPRTRSLPSYATLRSAAEDRAPIEEDRQGDGRSRLGLALIVVALLVVLGTVLFFGYRGIAP